MKVKRMSSLFCAVAFCGTASMAMAGAYGEAEQAEEMPRSAPAVAETAEVEEFAPFFYGAIGGLYDKEFFEQSARMINNTYGWGISGRFGYRFHPNVAVELLSENVIEVDGDSGDNRSPHKSNIDRAIYSVMPVVKIFPIEGWAEPFLSIGGGLVIADDGYNNRIADHINHHTSLRNVTEQPVDDGMGFGMRFGLGADFYATENVFIEPEVAYNLPLTSNVATYDNLSATLSIGYAFR